MRVFCSSGLIDRPSYHLYVRTIPLSGYMDRRSRYSRIIWYLFPWIDWWGNFPVLSMYMFPLVSYILMKTTRFSSAGGGLIPGCEDLVECTPLY